MGLKSKYRMVENVSLNAKPLLNYSNYYYHRITDILSLSTLEVPLT